MKTKRIDAIRRQLGISLTAISKYNNEQRAVIERIGDIFDLKGENREKVLTLLYMFSSEEEDDVIQKYREQTGLNNTEHNPANLLEQYKVMLLTALIYNRAFYAMTENYRGFISAGLPVGKVEEEVLKTNTDNSPAKIYDIKPGLIGVDYVYHKIAAAPEKKGFNQFDELPLTYKGITGKLVFMGRDKKEVYLEFVFDKFQNIIPFELQVRFTIKNKEYPFIIYADEKHRRKDRDKGETVIFSDTQVVVYYSDDDKIEGG